ncbi:MAG: NYN domain-containing protein [Meiothermus sp.]|nr:NYN domain-containing protein [Meiothermus sp.]
MKTAIFVDGNNLYNGLKQRRVLERRRRISMPGLVRHLAPGAVIKKYYSALPEYGDGAQHLGFIEALRRQGWEVFLGRVQQGQEKGTDVALATDLVVLGMEGRYDRAVLVSGDGDLAPAVSRVVQMGKEVEVWSFQGLLSLELAQTAQTVRLLEEVPWEDVSYTA